MKRLLVLALVLLLPACGRDQPPAGETLAPDEQAVRDWIVGHADAPKMLRFLSWGPHDEEGRLAAAVEERRQAGQKRFGGVGLWFEAADLTPGTKIIYVRYSAVSNDSGFRQERNELYLLRDGKLVMKKWPGRPAPEPIRGTAHHGERWLDMALLSLE